MPRNMYREIIRLSCTRHLARVVCLSFNLNKSTSNLNKRTLSAALRHYFTTGGRC
jgi:hypothetical protein